MGAKFITFEGGEGTGKSTQARLLADRLRADGTEILLTREPGGSPFAETLRALLLNPDIPAHGALAETLLFYAARADHLQQMIRPALAAGRWVICDRFSDSTRIYQGAAGGLDPALIDQLDEIVVAPTIPDLTIILDLPVEVGMARANARRGPAQDAIVDSYESRDSTFHENLRRGFLQLAESDTKRYVVVDACGSIDDIARAVWMEVSRRLPASSQRCGAG